MNFQINFSGTSYEEKCKLYYKDQLLYDGYVEDLVTSLKGFLEIKLNYGHKNSLSTQVKRLGKKVLWIPIIENSNEILIKEYRAIVFSLFEMNILWKKLRYELTGDLRYIINVDIQDLKKLWIVNSGFNLQSDNIVEVFKYFKKNILAFSRPKTNMLKQTFDDLFMNDWINVKLNLKQIDSIQDKLIVYLDDEGKTIEWNALLQDNKDDIFINLGNQWGLQVFSHS